MHLQGLLQQMLHTSLRSPAPQSPTSSPSTISSHRPTATQTGTKPPQTAQPKDSLAAAPKCDPSRRQSSGLLAGDPCQGAETARWSVSGPASSRSKAAASAEGAGAATGKQVVSVVAKPELYSALTAAVSAVVQQAGLAPSQRSNCLKGISLQYHAEGGGSQVGGQGAPDERQGAQPEGQGAQLNGQGTQLGGQSAQVEGQTEGLRRQPSRPEGQRAGHEGQQPWCEGQHQNSSSAVLATASATSPPSHMASQHSCGQAHEGQVSTHHSTDDSQTRAQHAQHANHAQSNTAGVNDNLSASGQQVAGDGEQGGVCAGQAGGSGGVQAWQAQVAQAMQVLQAALQSSCMTKAEEPPAVLQTRWAASQPGPVLQVYVPTHGLILSCTDLSFHPFVCLSVQPSVCLSVCSLSDNASCSQSVGQHINQATNVSVKQPIGSSDNEFVTNPQQRDHALDDRVDLCTTNLSLLGPEEPAQYPLLCVQATANSHGTAE